MMIYTRNVLILHVACRVACFVWLTCVKRRAPRVIEKSLAVGQAKTSSQCRTMLLLYTSSSWRRREGLSA